MASWRFFTGDAANEIVEQCFMAAACIGAEAKEVFVVDQQQPAVCGRLIAYVAVLNIHGYECIPQCMIRGDFSENG